MKRNRNMSRQVTRQRKRRRSRRAKHGAVSARSVGQFELLEDRWLLSSVPFVSSPIFTFESQFLETGNGSDFQDISLSIEKSGAGSNIFSLHMERISGSFDPAEIVIEDSEGEEITPILSIPDAHGGNGSFLLASLRPGTYTVMAGREEDGLGRFKIDAYLLGDSGDGQVSSQELLFATAGVVQGQFGGNHITAQFYRQQGIDFSQNLYRIGSDANFNGVMDEFDLKMIQRNVGSGPIEIDLFDERDPPDINIILENDTGHEAFEGSDSDNITSDPSIIGTVLDASVVVAFEAALDGMEPVDFLDRIGFLNVFNIDQSTFQTLNDGEPLNDGEHTLMFTAEDTHGNVGTAEFTFTLDRSTPAAPTNIDLTDFSDTGFSGNDDITQVTTPFIRINAEQDTVVEVFDGSTANPIGEGALEDNGLFMITQRLSEGDHTIRVRAIDAAGNVSPLSDIDDLTITIDATLPDAPEFTIDPEGLVDKDGNPVATEPMVDLMGMTEPNAFVDLKIGNDPIDSTRADASGAFMFEDVDLNTAFGSITLSALATDVAGNQSTFNQTITVDRPPFETEPMGPFVVDEDANALTLQNIFDLFDDLDLDDGDMLTIDILSQSDPLLTAELVGPENGPFDTLRVEFGADQAGNGTVTLRATDSFGLTATSDIDFTVQAVNDAPVITAPEMQQVNEDTLRAITGISIHDVDVDPEDEILAVTITTNNGILELDQDALDALESASGNGEKMVELHGNLNDLNTALGTLTYNPDTDFHGPDSVVVTLDDQGNTGQGEPLSDEATIDVDVVPLNDAPVVSVPTMVSTDEDQEVSIAGVSVSDVDIGTGDVEVELKANFGVLNVDANSLTIEGAETPTLTLTGTLDDVNTALGTLTYLGNENFNGTDTIVVTANDLGNTGVDGEMTDQKDFDVEVMGVNDPPEAKNDTFGVRHNQPTGNLDVLENDEDPDLPNDTLTIVDFDAETVEGGTVTKETDGTFTYTPPEEFADLEPGQTAEDSFTYTIEDDGHVMSTATVNLNVATNAPPDAVDDFAETDEATAIDIDVLANDTDPDGDDALLMVTGVGVNPTNTQGVSTEGATVTIVGGQVHYDPSTSASLQDLSPGDPPIVDTFFYEVTDEDGISSTGVVEVTVSGLNDPPEIEEQAFLVVENSANGTVVGTVAASDPNGDGFTFSIIGGTGEGVFAINADSGQITVADNTTLDFETNPTFSLEVQVTDDAAMARSSSATMTINLDDATDAPELVNPIADLELSDVDPSNLPNPGPQPDPIDLSNVFNDDDSDLTFEIVSNTNSELIDVSLNGDQLEVTYLPYLSRQDRTPAMVTVKATEVGEGREVFDSFMVTVGPQFTLEVHLVVSAEPTPQLPERDDFQREVLPESLSKAIVGETYVLEVYIKDLLVPNVIAGEEFSPGPGGGFVDITYNDAVVADLVQEDITLTFPFDVPPNNPPPDFGGNVETDGLIHKFGNIAITTHGLDPFFTRWGFIEFEATDVGLQEFELSFDGINTTLGRLGDPLIIGDEIHPSQVRIVNTSVEQVESFTFNVDMAASELIFGGTSDGAALTPQDVGVSDRSRVTGTIEVVIDDLDNPTIIEILGADLTLENTGTWEPDVGGTNGSAPANLGFTVDVGGNPQRFAVRDLSLNITSDPLAINASGQFPSADQEWMVTSGAVDSRFLNFEFSEDITGDEFVDDGSSPSTLTEDGGTFTLTLPINRLLTTTVGSPFELGINAGGSEIVATFTSGAPLLATVGAEAVAEATGTGVYMTLTQEPTSVGSDGHMAALPQSETWIDEWDSYWVELWVNTDQAGGVTSGMVDLVYDTRYATATVIEHGGVFVNATTGVINDAAGVVAGLGGSTTQAAVGTDGFALLGRVKFEPTADDQVPVDMENQFLGPYDLGLKLADAQLEVAGAGSVDVTLGDAPNTQLWAVVYDVDDDDVIGFGDLAYLSASFLEDTVTSDSPYAAALDFDRSGRVDFGDLAYLSNNFLVSKASGVDVIFPETFQQSWIGSTMDVDGSTSVGALLARAVDTWQQALGSSEPVDVQLVVRDFGDSQLGEGQILGVNEEGRPVRGRVTIDDDAYGLGWYSDLTASSDSGRYDLYTVLLHEVGHVLGFTPAYEGFSSLVEQGGTTLIGMDFSAQLDTAAEHLEPSAHSGDVMNSTLSPDVRKLPSVLDVQILKASYAAAAAGASRFSSDAAALRDGLEHDGLEFVSMSTADLAAGFLIDRSKSEGRSGSDGVTFGDWEGSTRSAHIARVDAGLSYGRPHFQVYEDEVFGDVDLLETFRPEDAEDELFSALSSELEGHDDSEPLDAVFAEWDELRF